MTKAEAKRWACGEAAAFLESDIETALPDDAGIPDVEKKRAAFKELIEELRDRAKEFK